MDCEISAEIVGTVPLVVYSCVVGGGLCPLCTEQPREEEIKKQSPLGVLVLFPYKKPYTKALGKDGVLVCHEKSAMHWHASEQADLFKSNVRNP